ncbi:ADP-ribosylation factor protein 3 [Kappamyces sp. JEL0829]|nr:ADP-ribosylation factor protein 3 [Kappamyces sp. JEL0829]
MYTLATGLYQEWTQIEQYFVMIIGLDNAGKTTLLERIKVLFTNAKGLRPDQIAPTVGLNVGKVNALGSRLNFWDLGGQKQLLSIWSKYYEDCHGIVFVVDSSDMQRIDECKTVLGTMGCRLTPEQVIQNDATQDVPVLMLANKQDVPGRAAGSDAGALKLHEIKEVFNKIAVRLEARDSRVLLVSALTGYAVSC